MYTTPGTYTVNWTCWNDLDEIYEEIRDVHIHKPVEGLTPAEEEYDVIYGNSINVGFVFDTDTSTAVSVTVEDMTGKAFKLVTVF